MPSATQWDGEFQVNTSPTNDGYVNAGASPVVTGLANGRFVVTWTHSGGAPGDTSDVHAQLFNADGSKLGGEVTVNTNAIGSQYDAAVTALGDGRFVAAWTDNSGTGGDSGPAVHAQVFEANGLKLGNELLVNTTVTGAQGASAVAALDGGGFVVTWTDESLSADDPSSAAVRAQVFDVGGAKSGSELLVNATIQGVQNAPAVTGVTGGGFEVAWQDYSQSGGDNSGFAVRAQLFGPGAAVTGSEVLVNTATPSNQSSPAVARLAGGGSVVAWHDHSASGGDASPYAIKAQLLDATGAKSGAEFLVNTTTANSQDSPAIAALGDGRFVVAWADMSQTGGDTSGYAIRAQMFNGDGTPSGGEFLVNTLTVANQYLPTLAALADGRFVATWLDASGGDPSGYQVHAQIFDARDAPVNLAGTTLDDDFVGTRFHDTMAGGDGNDRLDGGADADTISGGDGNDMLIGGDGNDNLSGGNGDDTIAAGGNSGGDDLAGGAGNDTFVIEDDYGTLTELANQGIDTVLARVSLTLEANVENLTLTGAAPITGTGNGLDNTIYGNEGANLLDGAGGNDSLLGAGGADTIIAGAGKDLMTGGGGLDRMVFKALSDSGTAFAQRDVINTFAHGDKIDVSTLDANSKVAGNQAFTFVDHFSGVAGQLQWDQTATSGYLVQGDLNGDGAADFSLQIYAAPGFGTVHGWDFIL